MELTVLNTAGKETGKKVQISDSIVNAEPNDHAIYLDVKQYLANQRQGTHKSKERSEMTGSTKKLGKQKGGGGARRGDINSPLLHGGARVFGPRPRDYSFKLNKKLKRLARLSALSYKFKESNVMVVEDLSFDAPKTKRMVEILKNLNLSEKKSLIVLAESNKFVFLSSRNLPQIKVVNVSDLNTYDILNAKNLLFVESSAKKLDEIYATQE
ncbi:MAG: 50S ribosomal protein L4 [Bacteroides sp.]|nr:50S ribosomal protein L4 [Bacteroides sp.]MCM1085678.1 50S ribosomal protein L4 [Bacteroides sp.]MCM1532524.1 50S ribosomal protein L4 [Ruminococcus flavefaciens]MCM1555682.1 50S ribosomal protein L4 [Bacteroides sp.]